MKKLLLICSCFLSVLVVAQVTEKPYEFPVKPGTEQWVNLGSSKEMDEVCIIPDQVLSALSTKALLFTCLDYPRLIDIFLADNLQSGFNFSSNHFNGLKELLKRPDLGQVLIKSYVNIDIQKNTLEGYDSKLTNFQIAFFEILLAQKEIINQFDLLEKRNLLSDAVKKIELRKDLRQSIYRQSTSAFIISRVLFSENSVLSEQDKYGNEIFSLFNSYAIITDTTIIDKLLVASKTFK